MSILIRFFLVPVFIILALVFILPPKVSAQTIEMSLTPKEVSSGDTVKVTVKNLPLVEAAYAISVRLSSATISGAGTLGYVQIITTRSGCEIRVPSDAWTSRTTPSCTGTGPFTFIGDLDTSALAAETDSTLDITYSVTIGGTVSDELASDNFTVKASQAAPAGSFNIDSVTPNPAKPDTDVEISISGATGSLGYGISGDKINSQNCSGSCKLLLHIPKESTNPTVNIIVRDSNNVAKSTSIDLDLPVAIDNKLTINKDIPVLTCSGSGCPSGKGVDCGDERSVQTAIGCISTTPEGLVKDILRFSTGIGGGIAFLLMIFGAFRMITSQGNPQELKEGQEIFTNAIIGLLFIIFSVLLMQIIGVNILNLPGFS